MSPSSFLRQGREHIESCNRTLRRRVTRRSESDWVVDCCHTDFFDRDISTVARRLDVWEFHRIQRVTTWYICSTSAPLP